MLGGEDMGTSMGGTRHCKKARDALDLLLSDMKVWLCQMDIICRKDCRLSCREEDDG